MSQEKVDALRAVYDEWAKGNFQAGGDLWDQRVLFIPIAELPDSGDYHGPEGVSRFMRGFLESWTEYTIAAEKFTEVGDSVVVATRQHGTGRDSGIAGGRSRQTHVWTFRGGAVIRFEAFANRAEALEAVGLSEQDARADS
jgi:ketosteroid isomerase-like protein